MPNGADGERFAGLGMLASALAGRPVAVDAAAPGRPAWTDGETVFVDRVGAPRTPATRSVAVQASLIAAGSLDPDVVGALVRHRRLADRYLAVEGHRALSANRALLPDVLAASADPGIGGLSDCAATSLTLARRREGPPDAPPSFGTIEPRKILAASVAAARVAEQRGAGHVPRRQSSGALEEFDEDDPDNWDDTDDPDLFSSPVGGGGAVGKWLKKLLSSARKTGGDAAGPPGADAPTHRTMSTTRGAHAVSSQAATSAEEVADIKTDGVKYPEWNAKRKKLPARLVHRPGGRAGVKAHATPADRGRHQRAAPARAPRYRPASPSPPASGRRHRHRRRGRGAGRDAWPARCPTRRVYIDSLRRTPRPRRCWCCSTSRARPPSRAPSGARCTSTSARRPRADRRRCTISATGWRSTPSTRRGAPRCSWCRSSGSTTTSTPQVIGRLDSLEPGAYTRLGAAIRHGSAVLEDRRRHVAAPAGRAVRRLRLRPRLRAALRRGRRPPRAGRGAPPRDRLRVPQRRRRHRRRRAAPGVRQRRPTPRSRAPSSSPGIVGPLFRSALRSAEVRRRVARRLGTGQVSR